MSSHAEIPPGFAPLQSGGPFIQHNGPLYLRHEGSVVQFGFRVERRHVNPMNNLHGGMMASFCDMLLPLSVHRKSDQVADRFLPTVSLQIDYLAPAPLGAWVQGEAQVLRMRFGIGGASRAVRKARPVSAHETRNGEAVACPVRG